MFTGKGKTIRERRKLTPRLRLKIAIAKVLRSVKNSLSNNFSISQSRKTLRTFSSGGGLFSNLRFLLGKTQTISDLMSIYGS